ncbi:MAG TPA: hypothetical protein VIT45_14595 [Allosphingosinicella sp.]
MAGRYEELKSPRFSVEPASGGELIRIPARRNWFLLLFVTLWLAVWTIGGLGTGAAVLREFNFAILISLAFWLLGVLFAATIISWQLVGVEFLRVVGGDLEIGYSFPGFQRSRLYRGGDIRSLAAAASNDMFAMFNWGFPPFLNWTRLGSIKFNYGARTIRAAASLDEAEGQMIVEYVRKRLPATAVEASSL